MVYICALTNCSFKLKVMEDTLYHIFQVRLLQVSDIILKTKRKDLNLEDLEILDAGCAACRAIWAVSESYKSKEEIYRLNAVPYFAKLLNCCHEEMVIATLGAITQCASQVLKTETSMRVEPCFLTISSIIMLSALFNSTIAFSF